MHSANYTNAYCAPHGNSVGVQLEKIEKGSNRFLILGAGVQVDRFDLEL